MGSILQRERGLLVGATTGDAIAQWTNREGVEYGTSWPVRVFEGSVERADVLSIKEHEMRVKALRVEREVPQSELFGPRAGEVVQFIDSVDRIRWLQPDPGPGVEARMAELVAEHYAALSDYGPVTTRPVRVVRVWHTARDVHATVEPRPEAENAAIHAACLMVGGTTAYITTQVAQNKVSRSAYFGAWEAAFREAGRSAGAIVHAVPWLRQTAGLDDHAGLTAAMRSADLFVKALAAAREPAFRAGWDAAYDLFTYAPGDIPPPEIMFAGAVIAAQRAVARAFPPRPIHSLDCMICASAPAVRDAMLADFITHTGRMVWTVTMNAAQLVGWRAAYLVNAVPRADPWRSLLEIWRLGGWPLGASKSAFVVFLPEPRN